MTFANFLGEKKRWIEIKNTEGERMREREWERVREGDKYSHADREVSLTKH